MSAILVRSGRTLATSRIAAQPSVFRVFASTSVSQTTEVDTSSTSANLEEAPNTHFKITLRRSAISLGDKKKGTLAALGLHRRFQTVYHRHTPEAAGKILAVKELLEVENVPTHMVMTKQQMRQERKASRGYQVVSNRRDGFLNV